jgi:uncharacterized protein (TIGR00251 family)
MCIDLRNVVRESKGKVLLSVRVQPRSRQNAITGVREKSLLLKVNAPPVDGAANQAVIALLAQELNLPKSTFSVQQGVKSREKIVKVEHVTADDVLKLLEKYF